MFFMITFILGFMLGKALRWETFPKCKAGLRYCLIRGLFFWLYLTQQDLFSDWGEVVVLMRTQISHGHFRQFLREMSSSFETGMMWFHDAYNWELILLMKGLFVMFWHYVCLFGIYTLNALPSHTNLDMKRELTYGWFVSSYPSYLYKRRMILS
jgi:hypothetical protein